MNKQKSILLVSLTLMLIFTTAACQKTDCTMQLGAGAAQACQESNSEK